MKAKKPFYFCACSFGKDSLATVLAAHKYGEPLDEVVFTEVMFNKHISGEIPEHIDWVKRVAIPKIKELGYKVRILHSRNTYVSEFTHKITKSKFAERNGKVRAFPIGDKCIILRDCKLEPMDKYIKRHKNNCVQYVGIAADELERLTRKNMQEQNRVSLLQKYGITEKAAYDWCQSEGLLSPLYEKATRSGCWFCPNQTLKEMQCFRHAHPELWARLEMLNKTGNKVSECFKYARTFDEVQRILDFMDRQLTIDFEL